MICSGSRSCCEIYNTEILYRTGSNSYALCRNLAEFSAVFRNNLDAEAVDLTRSNNKIEGASSLERSFHRDCTARIRNRHNSLNIRLRNSKVTCNILIVCCE